MTNNLTKHLNPIIILDTKIYISQRSIILSNEFKTWFKRTPIWYALHSENFKPEEVWTNLTILYTMCGHSNLFNFVIIFSHYCHLKKENIFIKDKIERKTILKHLILFVLILEHYGEISRHQIRQVVDNCLKENPENALHYSNEREYLNYLAEYNIKIRKQKRKIFRSGKIIIIIIHRIRKDGKLWTKGRDILNTFKHGEVVINGNSKNHFIPDLFPKYRKPIEIKLNNTQIFINKAIFDFIYTNLLSSYFKFSKYPISNITQLSIKIIKTIFDELKEVRNDCKDPIKIKFKVDFRGRIYPLYTVVSYMSTPFIRYLFELKPNYPKSLEITNKNSLSLINIIIKTSFKSLKEAHKHVQETDIQTYYYDEDLYWFIIFFKLNGYLGIIQYDARSRGFQHYAGLIGDTKLGSLLRISSQSKQGDLYQKVFETWYKTLDILERHAVTTTITEEIISGRSIIKKRVISYIYGAKIKTIWQYLFGVLQQKGIKYNTANKLIIAINSIVPNLEKVMYHFYCSLEINDKINITIPDGFQIPLYYYKKERVTVKVKYHHRQYHFARIIVVDKLDSLKTKRSIFVNIIHGLDAFHISSILQSTKCNFLPLHDCILFHIDDYYELQNLPIISYKKLYHDTNIIQIILKSIPNCPPDSDIQIHRNQLIKLVMPNKDIIPNKDCFKLNFAFNLSKHIT